jgi:sulfur carrier protein
VTTTLIVNGCERSSVAGSLAELLEELGYALPRLGLAVAVNEEIVPRTEWPRRAIMPGDRVEIVGAVQGG